MIKEHSEGVRMNKKYIIFSAEKMNWGEICLSGKEWLDTTWKIYNDGSYTEVQRFTNSGKFKVVSTEKEYVVQKEGELSDEKFARLLLIINDKFLQCSAGFGCDGEGWKMRSYAENGQILHQIEGMIYGDNVLEEIEQILLSPMS